jgi:esterase/lipase
MHVCNFFVFGFRWGASFLKWLQWVEDNFDKFKTPLLCMHGTADKMTLCDGSRLLVDKVRSADKELKVSEKKK